MLPLKFFEKKDYTESMEVSEANVLEDSPFVVWLGFPNINQTTHFDICLTWKFLFTSPSAVATPMIENGKFQGTHQKNIEEKEEKIDGGEAEETQSSTNLLVCFVSALFVDQFRLICISYILRIPPLCNALPFFK